MAEAYTSWKSAGGNNADHIGGNGYEFSYTDETGERKGSLQVDYGSLFCKKEETGYDCFIPVMPESNDILITHGHADHMGGLAHLLNLKRAELEEKRAKGENLTVHCTAFAEKLIKNSLQSTGIPKEEFPDFHVFSPDETFEVNGFKVEPFSVSHSIPDAVGFVIESPDGTRMMTTGDFKTAKVPLGKGFDDEKIAAIASKGVDYLFIDSTSSTVKGETIGESEVKKGLRAILKESENGPVISGVISSSCHRLHTVATALAEEALEKGTEPRTMILDGASLINARRAMNACGYRLEDIIREETGVEMKIVASNTKVALSTPPQNRFYICTGTQGEDASLLKIAEGRNKNISLAEMRETSGRGKDLPVYVYDLQSCIPGSEETHKALEEKFQAQGCVTYFPSRYKPNKYTIHASGHAGSGDVAKICKIVSGSSPRRTTVVPIHGDPAQRRNVMKIAQESGLGACIIPNMSEMRAFKKYATWESGGKTEEWIGVNDANNDFRRPYFKYDLLSMDVETKERTKTGYFKYKHAPRKNKGVGKAQAVQMTPAVAAARRKQSAR